MISAQTRARIAALLGREPRGLEDVPVVSDSGEPMVIRVASLVDDKPFPTLFWLVDPDLSYRIDGEEATGLIARLQLQIDEDPQLQEQMAADHSRYIQMRRAFMSETERERVESL